VGYTRLIQTIVGYTRLIQTIVGYTRRIQTIVGYTRLIQTIVGYTRRIQTIVGYTRRIQTIVGYTRLIQTMWDIQGLYKLCGIYKAYTNYVFCSVINFYNCKLNIFWFRVNGLKVLYFYILTV
jgi:hypothetical protein